MLDADTLARRVAALQAEQPGSAVAAATPLSVDDPDAVLLAVHRADPDLLRRLATQVSQAYQAARSKSVSDWPSIDGRYGDYTNAARSAMRLPDEEPLNSLREQAAVLRCLRLGLAARAFFLDYAGPPMSEADRLACQLVPTAVLAHRLSAQHGSGPHPLEPTLAGPAPGLDLEPVPAGKARKTAA